MSFLVSIFRNTLLYKVYYYLLSGKSTLLDVLACRLESNALFGNVLCNGSVVDKRSFRKETGYVMQNDALFPMLTVRETIRFAAYLRIANATRQEKNEIADKTITLLRLDDCADTIVGDNDNRGISGGQKRRVSIGVDIVHEPSVIFLDEPTSGLDSSTALSVVESLKQLCAKRNSTIVMTIHQPSARLFGLLDKILFLNHGRVTYFGPTSETINAVHAIYAEANLGNAPTGNAPELFLDITDQLEAEGRLELVTDKHRELETVQSALIANGVKAYVGKNIPVSIDSYANSLAGDTMILFERALLNILRTKEHFFARLGASVFFGVQMGTLFLFTNQNAQGIQFRAAYFAFTLAFYYWTSLEALPIFLAEREIFQREYSRGAYRAAAYTVSSSIVYFPFLFTLGLVYTAISWWLVGLPNQASIFFFQVLIVWLVTIAGHTFSTMISVLVPNPMAGMHL